ncbi:MAG: hypothetical protein ACLT46_17950 [Hungatella sp.]
MKKAKQIPAMNPMDSNYRRLLIAGMRMILFAENRSKEDAEPSRLILAGT